MSYKQECRKCGKKIDPESRKGFRVNTVTGDYFCSEKCMVTYETPMKRRFLVTVKEVYKMDIPVDAVDEDDARELVSDMLAEDSIPEGIKTEYSYTEEEYEWTVRKR